MYSCEDQTEVWGCPIRRFTDQSLFAAPRNFSQRTTSFIASQCQGIHKMPLSRLIVLIIDTHPSGLYMGANAASRTRAFLDRRECGKPHAR